MWNVGRTGQALSLLGFTLEELRKDASFQGREGICRGADSELRREEVFSHLEPHIRKYPANISSAKHKERNSVTLTSTVPSGSQHSRRDSGSMIRGSFRQNLASEHMSELLSLPWHHWLTE